MGKKYAVKDDFRDNGLSTYLLGLLFIDFYYPNAPYFAKNEQNIFLKRSSF